MFDSVLIANRGEIACRVIDTCRRMGVRSVAVYSDADANARHTQLADDSRHIGSAPAADSYLCIPRIIEAARASGAQAIHPGYGFLSENADFADACLQAGIVLIGPPAAAMRAMGSKAAAKALMAAAGVPLVPGYHGERQDAATLAAQADAIGFPVLIKASAGGGGRGMRVVDDAHSLLAAIEGAAREARASFGDGRLLIEKYLTRPRHIEIQVFADSHGNIVSLFERDCSIQRRHQKVIEEAPAPGIDPERRRMMGQAATDAARAVGYVGAGTVEFIVEAGAFYFMEMNTRLQVEHPVTEAITGQDLVEWQLRVAAGERLPRLQDELGIEGHAIEARIYAEDPSRDFLPSIGRIVHLHPPEGAYVRVDTGVRQGDIITPYYDAMIAKLIVWGQDRAEALRRMRTALRAYELVGLQTNLDLLRQVADDPDFAVGGVDTGFIGRHPHILHAPAPRDAARHAIWLAGAWTTHLDRMRAASPGDPWSPWAAADGWRLNLPGHEDVLLHDGAISVPIRLHATSTDRWIADLPDGPVSVRFDQDADGGLLLTVSGQVHRLRVVRVADGLVVVAAGQNHSLQVLDPLAPPALADAAAGRVTAPIPARVARILVAAGDQVRRGDPLLVLEAMKMELTLSAPHDGTVATIRHAIGEMVQEGAELVTFAPTEDGLAPAARAS